MENSINIEAGKLYKESPEFWGDDSVTFKVAEIGKDGIYFHRFVNGIECSDWSFYPNVELNQGILIAA